MTSGVYRIRNRVTGSVYIGSSKDLEFRLRAHFVALTNGRHDNLPLVRAWQAYGANAFAFGILEVTTADNPALIAAEDRWLRRTAAAGTTLYNRRMTGATGRHERKIREKIPPRPRGRPRRAHLEAELHAERRRRASQSEEGQE